MNKILSGVLATAMAIGFSATAFAAPIYESDDTLKNTVTGFEGGAHSHEQDLTQMSGKAEITFDLGANADYYAVRFDFVEGKKVLSAEFDREKSAVVLEPKMDLRAAEPRDYEIEIAVLDRKGKDVVAEGYTLHGTVAFDRTQTVQSSKSYHNGDGVLYDFGKGAQEVQIDVGEDVTLALAKTPRGIVNLRMTTQGNDSIDYMFSKHQLAYRRFESQPKFSTPVEVTIPAGEGTYLYEYADGNLRKVSDARFSSGTGYTFQTKQLTTYIIASDLLSEGVVNEAANTIRPSGGFSSGGDIIKDNPTTGAPDAAGSLLAAAVMPLAAAAVTAKRPE